MARRFGRNQKRKLREDAANAKKAMDAAHERSRGYAQEADRARHDLWDMVENVERLLGEHSAVLPPKNVRARYEAWEREIRMEYFQHRDLAPFSMNAAPVPREVIYTTLKRLHVECRDVERRHAVSGARHFQARVDFGNKGYCLEYFLTDEALRVITAENLAERLAKQFVEEIRKHFNKLEAGKV